MNSQHLHVFVMNGIVCCRRESFCAWVDRVVVGFDPSLPVYCDVPRKTSKRIYKTMRSLERLEKSTHPMAVAKKSRADAAAKWITIARGILGRMIPTKSPSVQRKIKTVLGISS